MMSSISRQRGQLRSASDAYGTSSGIYVTYLMIAMKTLLSDMFLLLAMDKSEGSITRRSIPGESMLPPRMIATGIKDQCYNVGSIHGMVNARQTSPKQAIPEKLVDPEFKSNDRVSFRR
ncbi:hypothetical protein PHSY_003265 [Pseudozyma hubeiensis SY62]|uniref:Uncharacterized protein n=1 Tax=Pseudozyma hubeiensis (strain SY62) TaxID=1305764 RepID=R9P308_PSEHS|nr:hypothetical protein PHSY_003265 [Pseudozyma hubeiensis SY62]GAC95689.1 hypothetical protein PHSY_003265 [Pseudozyma hubeiensis SY62]